VYDAFALIQQMGISASALIQATTNEPTSATERDFQTVLRSRYEPRTGETWSSRSTTSCAACNAMRWWITFFIR